MRSGLLVAATMFVGTLALSAQGNAYRPGNGVSTPVLVKEAKPVYTPEAKAAKIEGTVLMGAVVQADGTVADVKIIRSLDAKYGLDEQAVKAAKQWLFKPGMRQGKPVAVLVTIELAFTLPRK